MGSSADEKREWNAVEQSDLIVAELYIVLQKNRTLWKLSVYNDNRFQELELGSIGGH
jgi:hypothetical protein